MIEGSTLYSQSSWVSETSCGFSLHDDYVSMTHSSTSSECGDDLSLDLGTCSWNDINLLESPLNQVLEGNLSDWVVSEIPNSVSITHTDSAVQNLRQKKKNEKSKFNLERYNKKKWSELDSDVQVKLVEDLTHLISTRMGLREQLDVIRIIDPTAVILTTDTEFVIDLNCIDDNKWQAIKKSVQKTIGSSSKRKRAVKSNSRIKQSTHKEQPPSQSSPKKKNRQQKLQMNAERQYEKKQYKQMMKEHKSGLFKREEILSLSSSYTLDEEEIDILD